MAGTRQASYLTSWPPSWPARMQIVEDCKPGLHYKAWRRPLRRGLYMYRSVAVISGVTPRQLRAFHLDDAIRYGAGRGWGGRGGEGQGGLLQDGAAGPRLRGKALGLRVVQTWAALCPSQASSTLPSVTAAAAPALKPLRAL